MGKYWEQVLTLHRYVIIYGDIVDVRSKSFQLGRASSCSLVSWDLRGSEASGESRDLYISSLLSNLNYIPNLEIFTAVLQSFN